MTDSNLYSPVNESSDSAKTVFQSYAIHEEMVIKNEYFTAHQLIENIDATVNTWIRIIGVNDVKSITDFCNAIKIHPLAIEDIFHLNQRPKTEVYEDFTFIIMRELLMAGDELDSYQIAFIVKNNLLISIEEERSAAIGNFAEKLNTGTYSGKKVGEDYWLFKIMDTIIDSYQLLNEMIETKLEAIEDKLVLSARKAYLTELMQYKQNVMLMRKDIAPVRELLSVLSIEDISYFDKKNKYFLRNMQDHIYRVLEGIDAFRETLHILMDLYHSQLNNRMNEIMKTLTILSSIFIPLTFIVGVYGMNFENMPELKTQNGYYVVWAVMILIAIGILIYFKRKKYF